MQKECRKLYTIILFAVIAGIGIWMLPVMRGIIFPPDEYGYWTNVAVISGLDWKPINQLNPYYAFGYSLLLTPFLKIALLLESSGMLSCTEAMTFAYRLAICMNLCLVFLHGILLRAILKRLFTDAEPEKLDMISLCGALYSSVLVYMQYTLSEVLLNLLFLCVLWGFLKYLEPESGLKQACILAMSAGAAYFVHMRSIGIWAALVLAVILEFFLDKKQEKRRKAKQVLWFLGITILCLLLAEIGKHFLQDMLYGASHLDIAAKNDYGGQFEKIKFLFSWEGITAYIAGIAGKIFYLGNTTFGLFYMAMFFVWKKAVGRRTDNCKKENGKCNGQTETWFFRFLLLAIGANLCVAVLGMAGSDRIDGLLYGRYSENVVPVLICLGMVEHLKTKQPFKRAVFMIAGNGFWVTIVSFYVQKMQITKYLPDFAIGIAYAAGQHPDQVRDIILRPYLAGSIGILALAGLSGLVQKKKVSFGWVSMVAAVFLGISVAISRENIRPHQNDNLGDMQIAEKIRELNGEQDRKVVLLHSEWNEYGDVIQFFLPEQSISVIPEEETNLFALGESDLILTYRDDQRKEALKFLYQIMDSSVHVNLHYNRMGEKK